MATNVAIFVVDELRASVAFANPAAAELLGRPVTSLIGQPFGLPTEAGLTGELDVTRPDGTVIIIDMHTAPVVWNGRPAIVATMREVTERRISERLLRASEERYALASQGANDGLWDWDIDDNRLYTSLRWQEILGYGDEDVGDSPEKWLSRIHPDDEPGFQQTFHAHLRGETEHFEHEHRLRHRHGSYVWVLARGVAIRRDNRPVRFSGSLTDITPRKQVEGELRRIAHHDDLTGLPNRALFLDRLDRSLQRLCREPGHQYLAVLFLDLNGFKAINDSLGHEAGDVLLDETARRIALAVRPTDTVARLGGDEFTVLLERVDSPEQALEVAGRIQEAIVQPLDVGGQRVYTSASIGIALSDGTEAPGVEGEPPRPVSASSLVRNADIAMYQAKSGGHGSQLFDQGMHDRAVEQLRLHGDLRRGLDEHQFLFRYQPVVDLATGTMVGLEALLWWNHPTRGRLGPRQFVPAAEEIGVLGPISWTALHDALTSLRPWLQGAHPLRLCLNVSPRQFADERFAERIETELATAGITGHALQIELPEDALVADVERSRVHIARCRALGVSVAIDDFGTGRSSFGVLHELPVDVLKIDQTVIEALGTGRDSSPVFASIIGLADAMGLTVVAEGVEREDQRDLLLRLGCPTAQGWFFSTPLDLLRLHDLLTTA
jgi:diguanylate cyclase (GGDEF)-like protein/PAS domain S-box-containing protein